MEPEPSELAVCGYYDDWFRPGMAESVLAAANEFEDWELELFISSQAIYASNFLSLN